jgi:Arc/MetJ-type ribon-helix-helix transcriptional regulator
MTSEQHEPEVTESSPKETAAKADWQEAFDHAVKAAREAFNAAAEATAEILRQGGKLAEQTVDEAQRTIVITLGEGTIKSLDKMVAAGVYKTRAEAIRALIHQGLEVSGDLLARIDQVESQIEDLRAKMREIPLEGKQE